MLIEAAVQAIIQATRDIGEDPMRYKDDCIRRVEQFGGMDRFCREIRKVVRSFE
jgi:hypothetical protein